MLKKLYSYLFIYLVSNVCLGKGGDENPTVTITMYNFITYKQSQTKIKKLCMYYQGVIEFF